jgi:hypothetical protein
MFKVTRWFALSLVCVAVIGIAATGATARTAVVTATTGPTQPIRSALYDPIFRGSQKATAFALARQAGARYARISVLWKLIAPRTLPSKGWDPTNPSSSYYHWDSVDAMVSAAVAHGITPILDIMAPPTWGYNVQPGPGTGGQPKVDALGAFAMALARRYNGSGPAPAVHAFSVWNEPNFKSNFFPQDPTYYLQMANAVADSVHAVNPANLALAGELAAAKHPATATDKNNAIPPLTWLREMLCISNTAPAQHTCSATAHFDVWTLHPYSDRGPFSHATADGGVELGDLPKASALLKTAYQLGAFSSAQPPQIWVTEIGWASNPPSKRAVPMGLLTRWVSETYYQMWNSGVTLGTWFLLQDLPAPSPSQSGLYTNSASLSNAVAKPLVVPFGFPFVAYLKSAGQVQIWGRDPNSDVQNVAIQLKTSAGWQTVATITSNTNRIFAATMQLHALASWQLRATTQGRSSATFSLTVPSNENLAVVPFPPN